MQPPPSTQEGDYWLGYPRYTRAQLEKMRDQDPWARQAAALDVERARHDMMYALFMHPEKQGALLERVLRACYSLIEKKYAPDLEKSRMF